MRHNCLFVRMILLHDLKRGYQITIARYNVTTVIMIEMCVIQYLASNIYIRLFLLEDIILHTTHSAFFRLR